MLTYHCCWILLHIALTCYGDDSDTLTSQQFPTDDISTNNGSIHLDNSKENIDLVELKNVETNLTDFQPDANSTSFVIGEANLDEVSGHSLVGETWITESPQSWVDDEALQLCSLWEGMCGAEDFNFFLLKLRRRTEMRRDEILRLEAAQQLGPDGRKFRCVSYNVTNPPSVRILNTTQGLLQQLGTATMSTAVPSRNATSSTAGPGRCTVVLFYAPWCRFSALLAPHYNALARAFPTLDVVAIDAYQFSHINSRFGTSSVPNVIVFHNSKSIGRFNGSERTLNALSSFVHNLTGVQPNESVTVTEDDYIGPLASVATTEPDYLLWLSWIFVIGCAVVGTVRSSVGIKVFNTLAAMGRHEEHHIQHLD